MIDTVLHGDALEELRKLPDNSVDALCCDPPAGISFMNAEFDRDRGGRKQWIAWLCSIMTEVYRVLKPGAHGLVWALPRTSHWTATALEDAGFEIRDSIYHLYSKHDKLQSFMATLNDEQKAVFETLMEDDSIRLHIFGQGFPKSHDISKAIDRHFNAEREVVGHNVRLGDKKPYSFNESSMFGQDSGNKGLQYITAPATPLAQRWSGWGSATKPSAEVWWLIRKPLGESSIAKNVMTHGTGAINIDASRIGTDEQISNHSRSSQSAISKGIYGDSAMQETLQTAGQKLGRWPANTLLTHTLLCTDEQCVEYCPVALLDEQSGVRPVSGSAKNGHTAKGNHYDVTKNVYGKGLGSKQGTLHNDQGGASRYFKQLRPDVPFIYAPKASRRERNAGCEALPERAGFDKNTSKQIAHINHATGETTYSEYSPSARQNNHPTVKSLSLMKYLLRLITPPNGIVLDCFAGSGSTLCAAIHEGFHYVGVEAEAEYIEIINARLAHTRKEVHGALFACGD